MSHPLPHWHSLLEQAEEAGSNYTTYSKMNPSSHTGSPLDSHGINPSSVLGTKGCFDVEGWALSIWAAGCGCTTIGERGQGKEREG